MVQLAEKHKTGLKVGLRTYHLHLTGRVQGVGFRPYVYKFACAHQLKGNVRNDGDGVHVYFNARDQEAADKISRALVSHAPALSIIKSAVLEKSDTQRFQHFAIAESKDTSERKLMITPDLGICQSCRTELCDEDDRRFYYPFITCTNCGPRYSIIEGLPYDRPLTTMSDFDMCDACAGEYSDILDRRHYSQTNSCGKCPVSMSIYDRDGSLIIDRDNLLTINHMSSKIRSGEIVAVKGVGGYLLIADATNRKAVALLRKRKHRPRKPFALMYRDIEMLAGDVELLPSEVDLLQSSAAPIVLLPLKSVTQSGLATKMICPGLAKVGAMLPYTGVYELLLRQLDVPIVATSANISDSPIVYRDDQALAELVSLADAVVVNDRMICVPQDDSVIRYAHNGRQPIILRRSRGLAPSLRNNPVPNWDRSVFATGADLKAAFGLNHNKELYISQYLGNLEFLGSQESYRNTYRHLGGLLNFDPELVVSDMHPGYYSLDMAERESALCNIPHLKVQHHVAHFCSVLGENELLDIDEPVLGVIWDGTGYGTDGQIWGGEFFTYENRQIERFGHFRYFPQLLGDKMSRESRLSAYAMVGDDPEWREELQLMFTGSELSIYKRVGTSGLETSSAGRIFDAVAAVLGLCYKMEYEGEAAILLEEAASTWLDDHHDSGRSYDFTIASTGIVDWSLLFKGIKRDLALGMDRGEIALCFHNTLVQIIEEIAKMAGVKQISFSGGCFQNALLVALCRSLERKGYNLSFHHELSPNDENIAHGQIVYAYLKSLNVELNFSK